MAADARRLSRPLGGHGADGFRQTTTALAASSVHMGMCVYVCVHVVTHCCMCIMYSLYQVVCILACVRVRMCLPLRITLRDHRSYRSHWHWWPRFSHERPPCGEEKKELEEIRATPPAHVRRPTGNPHPRTVDGAPQTSLRWDSRQCPTKDILALGE